MIANSNTLNNTPSRKIDAFVKVYTSEYGHYDTYTKSDALQEIAVSRAGEHGKFFGFGVCQQVTIKLIDRNKNISISKNQRLQFTFSHFVNGSTEYALSVTDYYVKEVTRDEKTNVITITAYDVLDNATAHTFSELKMVAPYTIRDVADRVASFLGVSLEVPYGNAFQLNFEYGANFNGDETLRAVLNAIAEATQTIYYINNYSKLAFKSLKRSSEIVDLTIYKKDYFELTTADPIGLSYITSTNELGDSATVDIPNGDGVTQYVRDNPFWTNRTDLADILSDTVGRVSNLKIAPYNLKWRGNFFTEIGDYIAIEKKDGTFLKTHILHDSLTYNGGLTQTCTWESNPESDRATITNPITIGEKLNQTFARVDKVNKRIDLVASEVSDNKSEIAEIKLTTDDIILRVEKVENQEFDLDITDDENFIKLSERVGALEVSDTEIIASVSETKTTLQGYTDAAVSDIRDQLNSETSSMRSAVTAVTQAMSALQVKTGQIEASVSTTETTLKKYTDDAVAGVEDDLSDLGDTLRGEFQEGDSALNGEIATVKQDVSALTVKTGEIEASVSNLERSTASNLSDAVSGLTEKLGELEESLRAEYEAADEILNDALTGEVTAVREDISSLSVKADGITASVSSLQKITEQTAESVETEIAALAKEVNLKVDSKAVSISIEKALSAGVDKVVTSAKEYTFDDTGLNISSSDSEFSTQITEDGMKIYKGNTEVLTADNAGVQARDLHARTFLIIGENSRLEDRGNRTACFWIGPAGG
jgi:uncharacterized coiled-coil DUF342 family protein